MDHGRHHVGNRLGRIGAVVAAALVGGVLAVALAPEAAISAVRDTFVREQNLDADGFIRVHEQGTADVRVANDVVPVAGTVSAQLPDEVTTRDADPLPFVATGFETLGPGTGSVGVERPIPAGFILVVDQVTGFINLPPNGQSPRQLLVTTRGAFFGDTGALVSTQIVPHQQANLANSNYWVFNEQVTLYSTSRINLFFSRNDDQGLIATEGSAGIRWTLIGHLVADS
jgi:hypothetical protein